MSPITLETSPISIEMIPEIGSHRARESIKMLTDRILLWQENPNYMTYLKEGIRSEQQIIQHLKHELATEKATLFLLSDITSPETITRDTSHIVGYILYHFYDASRNALEISIRVSPTEQKRGICTHATQATSDELLTSGRVSEICGYHAAENDGTLKVNHRSGFKITEYLPDGAYLTYPNKYVDVFGWKKNPSGIYMPEYDKKSVHEGMNKYNVSSRLGAPIDAIALS